MTSEVVGKGMTQVHTGLGILLGAGRISSTTHEEILILLNKDHGPNMGHSNIIPQTNQVAMRDIPIGLPRPGKETPVSIQSHDLLGLGADFSDLAVVDRSPRGFVTPAFQRHTSSMNPTAPHSSNQGKVPKDAKLICPWWFTDGYDCREHEQGKCLFYHEDIVGGIRDPLICHFWADGGRCTKSDKDCRFAHYPAQHRTRAPMPSKKKAKKIRSSLADDVAHPELTKAHHPDENDVEFWRNQGRARPGQEW
ncbi:hypothetical protein F4781DRAFT_412267 [Annulohypoxylon bovei var. microspora]|nr:hypothetical protein F4781DRAFT_412267 [Annulohypoxylon bovei var. microspora]